MRSPKRSRPATARCRTSWAICCCRWSTTRRWPGRRAFDFDAVATAIADKMIRRHPHVFSIADAEAQSRPGRSKGPGTAAKAATSGQAASALDGVSAAYPALMRSMKLQRRAVRVGFDWPETADVFAKVEEELRELRDEVEREGDRKPDRVEDEMGDLLFTVANLARHLGNDPETAAPQRQVRRRFRSMESGLAAEGVRFLRPTSTTWSVIGAGQSSMKLSRPLNNLLFLNLERSMAKTAFITGATSGFGK